MNDFHEHDEHDEHEDIAHMPTEEEHPLWSKERIELKSVGIDIGSSTSHLMFSRLVLRRQGWALSSKFRVISREITYESPVLLTPFLSNIIIDTTTLSSFIDRAYAQSKTSPQQVNTGAVIITGEAARKENAEAIASLFSEQAGKFVCATAGPNLEAKMSAYGSGAVDKSWGEEGEGKAVMSVDVGGGTSKIAIAHKGVVVDTVAMNVGARLFVFNQTGRLARIEEPGKLVMEELGLNFSLGDKPTPEEKTRLARALAGALFEVLERKPLSPLCRKLMITPALSYTGKIDALLFSGGVSEYIYGYEKEDYGDLGNILAEEIRRLAKRTDFGIPLLEPVQRIRATVIGASQYTVQVSGSTIFISQDDLLPLRNLQVIAPHIDDSNITPEGIKKALQESFRRSDLQEGDYPIALALHWSAGPAYPLMKTLVTSVLSSLPRTIKKKLPIVLVFDADIGKLVGSLLAQEIGVGQKVISIDGIDLQDFDFVDIGEELPAGVVPVVIKSLIFRT